MKLVQDEKKKKITKAYNKLPAEEQNWLEQVNAQAPGST